jgi:hypothetical protein
MTNDSSRERQFDTGAGVANAGMIDLFAVDADKGEVLLVMNETRSWTGGDEQLHELQEKFNAYASFILDGEMVDANPELAAKRARIELRCDEMPSERALALIGTIHDQLALQEIEVEVVVRESAGAPNTSKTKSPASVRAFSGHAETRARSKRLPRSIHRRPF